jgi:hypothetical protein
MQPGELHAMGLNPSSNASGFLIEPGQWVRHPERPDWGDGQVQSAIGHRITVNFENAGKVLINASVVALEPILEDNSFPPRRQTGN